MLEQLLARLLANGQLRELTFEEVLVLEDGQEIIVAETVFANEKYRRLSIQELILDGQVKDELEILRSLATALEYPETRFFLPVP